MASSKSVLNTVILQNKLKCHPILRSQQLWQGQAHTHRHTWERTHTRAHTHTRMCRHMHALTHACTHTHRSDTLTPTTGQPPSHRRRVPLWSRCRGQVLGQTPRSWGPGVQGRAFLSMGLDEGGPRWGREPPPGVPPGHWILFLIFYTVVRAFLCFCLLLHVPLC